MYITSPQLLKQLLIHNQQSIKQFGKRYVTSFAKILKLHANWTSKLSSSYDHSYDFQDELCIILYSRCRILLCCRKQTIESRPMYKGHSVTRVEVEKVQSIKLAMRQLWVRSAGDFIFLVFAYKGRWPDLSLSHLPTQSVRSVYSLQLSWLGVYMEQNSETKLLPWQDFNPNRLITVQRENHYITEHPLRGMWQRSEFQASS